MVDRKVFNFFANVGLYIGDLICLNMKHKWIISKWLYHRKVYLFNTDALLVITNLSTNPFYAIASVHYHSKWLMLQKFTIILNCIMGRYQMLASLSDAWKSQSAQHHLQHWKITPFLLNWPTWLREISLNYIWKGFTEITSYSVEKSIIVHISPHELR